MTNWYKIVSISENYTFLLLLIPKKLKRITKKNCILGNNYHSF